MPTDGLSYKGRQTREALQQAARKLFAERGFHGTTLADITSAAGKSLAGYGRDLVPQHTAVAIALLFEQFTTVFLRPRASELGLRISDEDAIATLSTIWKKTLYGS